MRVNRHITAVVAIFLVSTAVVGWWGWLWAGGPANVGMADARDLAAVDPGFSADTFRPFAFLHFGDPQIGRTETAEDQARFLEAIREANALRPAFVVIAGDLTEAGGFAERIAFQRALKRLAVPVLIVPGNHDVFDSESRAYYHQNYGPDFYAITYNNCVFIGLNSELRPAQGPAGGAEGQLRFLEATLAAAQAARRTHVFIIQHTPPFLVPEAERNVDAGPDGPYRRRLLALARAYGVRTFLCGHTHTTWEIRAVDGAFTIYTASGTAEVREPDGRDACRYRLFRVGADRVEQTPVRLAASSSRAAS